MNKIVLPIDFNFSRTLRILILVSGKTPAVGSSRRKNSDSVASARANSSSLRCPCDRFWASSSFFSIKPTSSRYSNTLSCCG
nr:hypothetical protein [Candidatus Kryptobacter tengchongensis]